MHGVASQVNITQLVDILAIIWGVSYEVLIYTATEGGMASVLSLGSFVVYVSFHCNPHCIDSFTNYI